MWCNITADICQIFRRFSLPIHDIRLVVHGCTDGLNFRIDPLGAGIQVVRAGNFSIGPHGLLKLVAEKKGNIGKPRGKIAEHQLNILEFPERLWTSCVPKVEKQSCLQGNEGHVVFAFVAHHHHLSDGGSTGLHVSETLLKSREAGGFLNWGYPNSSLDGEKSQSKMDDIGWLPMTDPWCWYINANIKGVYWWDPCYQLLHSSTSRIRHGLGLPPWRNGKPR